MLELGHRVLDELDRENGPGRHLTSILDRLHGAVRARLFLRAPAVQLDTSTTLLVSLESVVAGWRPGSFDPPWSWDDEEEHLHALECMCCGRPGHYQQELEAHIAVHGLSQGVYLGPDGRVWDGHHRIVAARRLGLDRIPLEEGSATP